MTQTKTFPYCIACNQESWSVVTCPHCNTPFQVGYLDRVAQREYRNINLYCDHVEKLEYIICPCCHQLFHFSTHICERCEYQLDLLYWSSDFVIVEIDEEYEKFGFSPLEDQYLSIACRWDRQVGLPVDNDEEEGDTSEEEDKIEQEYEDDLGFDEAEGEEESDGEETGDEDDDWDEIIAFENELALASRRESVLYEYSTDDPDETVVEWIDDSIQARGSPLYGVIDEDEEEYYDDDDDFYDDEDDDLIDAEWDDDY